MDMKELKNNLMVFVGVGERGMRMESLVQAIDTKLAGYLQIPNAYEDMNMDEEYDLINLQLEDVLLVFYGDPFMDGTNHAINLTGEPFIHKTDEEIVEFMAGIAAMMEENTINVDLYDLFGLVEGTKNGMPSEVFQFVGKKEVWTNDYLKKLDALSDIPRKVLIGVSGDIGLVEVSEAMELLSKMFGEKSKIIFSVRATEEETDEISFICLSFFEE